MPGGRQLSLELDLTDELSRSWYYFGYDDYERSTIALWAQLVDRARTVFDVGANIGLYTLLAAARLQGRGAVHAFEPNNEVFAWLTRNAERNRLDNAHLSQIALSNLDGQASFFIPKNRAWTNGSLIEGFTDRADTVGIETMRVDTYCQKHGIGNVDLIKIDVEGAELKVLSGMGELLHKWKPDLICEVLPDYVGPLNNFFANTPYRKFLITPDCLQERSELRADSEFPRLLSELLTSFRCSTVVSVAHVPFTFTPHPIGGRNITLKGSVAHVGS